MGGKPRNDPNKKKFRILGVEDDPNQQLILDTVINGIRPNYSIDWVTTAEEASFELDRHDFALVIVDFSLGKGATGLELWEEQKSLKPNLPFLFVTSLSQDSFLRYIGRDEIIPAFLSKPIFGKEVAQVMDYLIQERIG